MGHKKHFIWFPFLLIAVTVILAVTIVLVDHNRQSVYVGIDSGEGMTVTQVALDGESIEVYREQLRDTLQPVWTMVDTGEGDALQIQEIRTAILDMRVPASEKDVHIASIAALHTLDAALSTGGVDALATAQVRFQALAQQAVWLK